MNIGPHEESAVDALAERLAEEAGIRLMFCQTQKLLSVPGLGGITFKEVVEWTVYR
ncbi:hypothetical protein H6775_00670 [Candidatus Nomurabacteria bacterium]|nr:hypothetical protein [Candidatus Nomurabacteria bacterium]